MVERLWCQVCNHGVDGVKGVECPECLHKGRGAGSGILKTPEQAIQDKLEMAKAVKLARSQNVIRGHKTMDERMKEMEASIMDRITAKFDLVPKGQASKVAVQPGTVDTKDETPMTVAEYRASKKETSTKK